MSNYFRILSVIRHSSKHESYTVACFGSFSLPKFDVDRGIPQPGHGRIRVPPPPSHCTEAGRLCGAGGMPLTFTQEDFLV